MNAERPKVALTVDMIGFFCPEPVIRTNEAIEEVGIGECIEVLADDPSSRSDIASWAKRTGHELVAVDEESGSFRFIIRRSG